MKEKIILQIRAGEGGKDSHLLVDEMAEFYKKVARVENFHVETMEERNSFTSLCL